MAVERTFRGISTRLAVRYLTNLGGAFRGDDPEDPAEPAIVEGDGWRATVTSERSSVGPSLSLTAVTVAFEGDDGTADGEGGAVDGDGEPLDDLVERFARKAMRAGG